MRRQGKSSGFFWERILAKEVKVLESAMVQEFRDRLESFVFFHLGSDAKLEIQEELESLAVKLEHPRIRPLGFTIETARLRRVLAEPVLFEEMMLEYLVTYRRS